MGYDGYLTSAEGIPVDSNIDLAIRICDAPVDGSCYFKQTFLSTLITNGYFSVALNGALNELLSAILLSEVLTVS